MSSFRALSGTPARCEWSPFHLGYLVDHLPGIPGNGAVLGGLEDDAATFLERQLRTIASLTDSVPVERERFRYAPGKWSVRELVGHLSDTERILCYRALAAARGDRTNLSPFEEEVYVSRAGHDEIPLSLLVEELVAVRRSTLAMVRTFTHEAWRGVGYSSGNPVSARAWVFVIGCHVDLHLNTLRTRYLA